ncbi:hypothetical protein RI129_005940 [Pyrocoelia pectoralis]|uniref:Uncharacterized protein n=1 Tax=Pyrocoelia pectoralis TaxID=417401 RepID=A0AAN7VAB7_9COLE
MKYLIVLSVVLAVVSASHPYAYGHLYGQHIPLIDHSGVPVDTPDVQAAKALHFSAHAAVRSGLHHVHGAHPLSYAAGLYHYPIVDPAGRPIDTPEVQHAKAAHFAAYNEAAARNAHHVYGTPIAIGHHHGVVDTPEVQVAKAAHFAAHAKAAAGHILKRRSAIYPFAQHIPIIDHKGVPLETPEVQAAKAEHFAAHAKVAAQSVAVGHHVAPHAIAPYAAVHGGFPIHIPVITPQGVPADTPEVQHSKAAHFAAHAEATARNAAVHYHHGLPLHY